MPADTDRLAKWVELGLVNNGHPTLDDVVATARTAGTAWAPLAAQISAMSGESVSHEWLRNRYPQLADGAGARP
jgi:hypothetical protein